MSKVPSTQPMNGRDWSLLHFPTKRAISDIAITQKVVLRSFADSKRKKKNENYLRHSTLVTTYVFLFSSSLLPELYLSAALLNEKKKSSDRFEG